MKNLLRKLANSAEFCAKERIQGTYLSGILEQRRIKVGLQPQSLCRAK